MWRRRCPNGEEVALDRHRRRFRHPFALLPNEVGFLRRRGRQAGTPIVSLPLAAAVNAWPSPSTMERTFPSPITSTRPKTFSVLRSNPHHVARFTDHPAVHRAPKSFFSCDRDNRASLQRLSSLRVEREQVRLIPRFCQPTCLSGLRCCRPRHDQQFAVEKR